MAENEYVGLTNSQKFYAQKNLLQSQADLLQTVKRYEKYKKYRKQELALKNLLKKVVNSLKEEIKNLDSYIPEVHEHKKKIINTTPKQKKRRELEDEINDIRKKIAALSAE